MFTRDQTLPIIESWYYAHDRGVKKWYSGERLKFPPMIFYFYDGAEETWHSVEQYYWILDAVQKEISINKYMVHEAILKYQKRMKPVKAFYGREKLDTIDQLEKFINDFFAAVPYFPAWYYAAVDDRTPTNIRKEAMKVRNYDLFYDENDRIVRNTIRNLYPELKGYETAILRKEIRRPPAIEVLRERKKNFVYIPGLFAESVTIEEYAKTHYNTIIINETKKYDKNKKEIIGQVAYKGRAKGRVRIIRRLDQMDKIERGDILVSPMTTPNYLTAMKKAAAFITDEGGITSHAAIVAREMKKPCIIGTKIATKVLKDGDLVEVDAERGVAKILKRS